MWVIAILDTEGDELIHPLLKRDSLEDALDYLAQTEIRWKTDDILHDEDDVYEYRIFDNGYQQLKIIFGNGGYIELNAIEIDEHYDDVIIYFIPNISPSVYKNEDEYTNKMNYKYELERYLREYKGVSIDSEIDLLDPNDEIYVLTEFSNKKSLYGGSVKVIVDDQERWFKW